MKGARIKEPATDLHTKDTRYSGRNRCDRANPRFGVNQCGSESLEAQFVQRAIYLTQVRNRKHAIMAPRAGDEELGPGAQPLGRVWCTVAALRGREAHSGRRYRQ